MLASMGKAVNDSGLRPHSFIGDQSLIFQYQTPTGNQPAANGNWVGLWQGSQAAFDGGNMLAKTRVDSDSNTGTAFLNGIYLERSVTYTAAYFIGPKNTDMAATCTWTT
jgi:hypothetical protein